MSWQSYIDDQLLAAGFMYATINGLEDGSLWAASPGFVALPEECLKLVKALQGDMTSVQASGFQIAGQNYTFTRGESADADDGAAANLQGRCKEKGKTSQGAIVYLTTQALVIGIHDPTYSSGASFGKVNTDIGRVADYMIESGY